MKKLLSSVSILLAGLMLFFAGCGKKGGETEKPEEEEQIMREIFKEGIE